MSRKALALIPFALLLVACGDDSTSATETVPESSTTTTVSTTTTEATVTTVPTTTIPPTTSVPATTAPPETTTTAAPSEEPGAEAAIQAFENWVGYLGEGDEQAAWDAMAPTSQASIGEDVYFGGLYTAMMEGWGSWSAGEDVSYRLEVDPNGRTLLWVSGTIHPEGHTEFREVAVPVVETESGYLVSPFEEFGNVAEAVEEELAGTEDPAVPADSGSGRRVVYSNSDQRVWLVGDDGTIVDSYLVSGKQGVPAPGTYEVYSRSEVAFAGHDDITMRYMVRFAHGENLPIGFHAIPNNASGAPLQSEEQLGEYHSAGCVRQSIAHAAFLYDWAVEGTTVVVLA